MFSLTKSLSLKNKVWLCWNRRRPGGSRRYRDHVDNIYHVNIEITAKFCTILGSLVLACPPCCCQNLRSNILFLVSQICECFKRQEFRCQELLRRDVFDESKHDYLQPDGPSVGRERYPPEDNGTQIMHDVLKHGIFSEK